MNTATVCISKQSFQGEQWEVLNRALFKLLKQWEDIDIKDIRVVTKNMNSDGGIKEEFICIEIERNEMNKNPPPLFKAIQMLTEKEGPTLKIIRVSPDVKLPVRANPTDSGLDVYAWKFKNLYHGKAESVTDVSKEKEIVLHPLERVLIDTGIKATVAPGYEIQIRPKSGRSLKEGLTVINTPGTVDCEYSYPIGVIIVNLSSQPRKIVLEEKIAQMVVQKVELLDIEEVTDLNNGSGRSGFGSTGIK